MFKYLKKISNCGFTTVELLVTLLVFSISAILIAGILARALNLNRRFSVTQTIQENALFVLEYMAREIRVSSIVNQNSNCTATSLNLDHPTNGSVSYALSNGTVVRTVGGRAGNLNSDTVEFSRLVYCISGSALGDNLPTRVTIVATIRDRSANPLASVNLQTTIDSRDLSN